MEDVQDSRPIRIRYFASFVLKSLKTKERVEQFKEIYRDYNKYKDLVATCGYDTSTEELFRKSVKDIAIRRIILVDDIYKKGSVIKDQ
ncbi:MAG: hypothetical protein IMZ64_14500 [Bacteroidetes bacterium]|nr:hypothetical protein [Bacteroidota bacterium]